MSWPLPRYLSLDPWVPRPRSSEGLVSSACHLLSWVTPQADAVLHCLSIALAINSDIPVFVPPPDNRNEKPPSAAGLLMAGVPRQAVGHSLAKEKSRQQRSAPRAVS